MLYRECMNEYGWIKRRETLNRAKITEEMDKILYDLRTKETAGEEPASEKMVDSEGEEAKVDEIYIPQAEYTAVCNADFLPMICNEFITEFLDKEHGAC
jgi:hypothetical protein